MTWSVLIVILSLLVITALIFGRIQWLKRKAVAQKSMGIVYIKQLVDVLIRIQQHRGLTTGYLGGDHSQLGQIEALEVTASRMLKELEADAWFQVNSRFKGIADHWPRLCGEYETLGLANNLTQHNKLITNILYLIEDVADAHSLCPAKGTVPTPRLMQMLQAAEYVGQARAIGTGVSAAGQCDSVARIRLLYLHGKIISAVLHSDQLDSDGKVPSKEPVKAFLTVLDGMTQENSKLIDASSYFALATQALDSVFSLVDLEIDALSADK